MADATELVAAWQEAIREVGRLAGSMVAKPAGRAAEFAEPLQRQAQLLERILQRQLDLERELVAVATAPARAALDVVEQAAAASRAQAQAFRAAADSFGQLAVLLEQQAALVERGAAALRDPVGTMRAAGDELRRAPRAARPSGRRPPRKPKS